jgi:hypothetical protein
VESPHNKAIDNDINGCAGEAQRSDEAKRVSGLFQALLEQAAELPQPPLHERKQTLSLVDVDAVGRYVSLLVHDYSMVAVHLPVRLEAVCPDLSQRLGEVFSLLNHWIKTISEVDATVSTDHAKRVGARRDERQLITVATPPT